MKNTTKNKENFFLVSPKALPKILNNVVKAKNLVANKGMTIQEAVKKVGISRASYYKYVDEVFVFYDNSKGKMVSLFVSSVDKLGLLSIVTGLISKYSFNILTIHQSIPVNGISDISFSLEVTNESGDISELVQEIENMDNVRYCKILAMEEKYS